MRNGHQSPRTAVRLSRPDVREAIGWGDTQLRVHLGRLAALEYLLVHRGGRGQRFVYELAVSPPADGATPMLPGLIPVEQLISHGYDAGYAGRTAQDAARSREAEPRGTIQAKADSGEDGANPTSRASQASAVVPTAGAEGL